MRVAVLSILTLVLCSYTNAQKKKSFVVKAGEIIKEAIPIQEIYTYPSFVNGTVFFRSGESSVGRLNYNMMEAEMEFIDANGDTLALADEPLVKMVVLTKDTFYFHNGYFQLVRSSKDYKLGKRAVFSIAKIEKAGAYDQPMPSSAVTLGGISTGSRIYNLVVRENLTFVKETALYFGNKNNEFLPASRKNLFKSFSKQEKKLEEYLANNEVRFSEEEDLLKLIHFLEKL